MKKFIALICFTVFLTACDRNISQSSSSDIENRSHTISAETPAPAPSPNEQPFNVVTSPDGMHSIYKTETEGYGSEYCILDNRTGRTVSLGEYYFPIDIKFLSDDTFCITESDYLVFDITGSMLYRLSDHFPLGILEDGRDIRLYDVYHKEDGRVLVVYYDGNERITPETEFNTGSVNQPYLYRICVVSADGTIEKTINTGKNVETHKHYGVSLYMEETDENNVVLYSEYYSDTNLTRGFEIHVNLLNGQCSVEDSRPEYSD